MDRGRLVGSVVRKGTILKLERVLYRMAVVPLIAFLPASLAYKVACLRGDWCYWYDSCKRGEINRCLEEVLGDQLSPEARSRVTRDVFRLRSCQAVDVTRLLGKGQALARQVEIRGLEHIENALAAGKGAILCSAHFSSVDSCFSLIGTRGFPITVVGRWVKGNRAVENRSSIETFVSEFIHRKILQRHRHRPNIEPRPGKLGVAVQAATVLRNNELLGILLDPPVLAADRARAVPMKFLNGQALLLPGVVTIAQLIGTPVLMTFLLRSADWRHQVLQISPPVPVDGDPVAAFGNCLAVVEATIRKNPAHWVFWNSSDLVDLGLLSEKTTKVLAECRVV
ncbi:MAG TPA: lysophospholipid acyltransferase family protein [Ktedonobacteraceae bacterium]|nr:lysophospholipid acyltransferase family protein [Ktedonobacteraceae bacterium]